MMVLTAHCVTGEQLQIWLSLATDEEVNKQFYGTPELKSILILVPFEFWDFL